MKSIHSERLIQRIQKAFAGVQLGNGISLNQTEYKDSYGCEPKFLERAKVDERHDWSRIPGKTLEEFTVTFSFTDLTGYRFYLPAYMIWTIKKFRTSESIISDFTIYAIDPESHQFEKVPFLDWFDHAQVLAMTSFLRFCMRYHYYLDADVAEENLNKIRKLIAQHPGWQ